MIFPLFAEIEPLKPGEAAQIIFKGRVKHFRLPLVSAPRRPRRLPPVEARKRCPGARRTARELFQGFETSHSSTALLATEVQWECECKRSAPTLLSKPFLPN